MAGGAAHPRTLPDERKHALDSPAQAALGRMAAKRRFSGADTW